jgi:hypothetical protein
MIAKATLPALLALGAAVLLVPALGSASTVKPVKYSTFCINCTPKMEPGNFHVSKSGLTIDSLTYFNNCAGVPAIGFPKTPILNGAFTRTATIKNVLGKKITYTLNGRFVGPKLATGSINATGAGKTCKAVSFKARFSGTGAAQIG